VTPVRKRTCDVEEKQHFITKVSYKSFSYWFERNKYGYRDSKQHLYLQYHAAATDMKALRKKQTTLQAVAYLGFPAPGDKLSLSAPTQHKIKDTLQSDALLAII